jgi:serine-type D-Ala-D-Ala carboxypeptidase (penicillin-binding protein 5/6)
VTHRDPPAATRVRTPIRALGVAELLAVIGAITAILTLQALGLSASTAATPIDRRGSGSPADSGPSRLPGTVWPARGQSSWSESGSAQVQASPNQHAAPIASLAKVMTAYLVIRDHPLQPGLEGPTITLSGADVADTARRRAGQESVVPIAIGEQLTELEALQALLLPSANNIAAVLARWDAGSASRFVAGMNEAARALGMTETTYTDPSGLDDATVSTPADQLRIVDWAMRSAVFARIVATPVATLPIAGTVRNTDALLGHGGFVGVKTGSDEAAGGCFAFRVSRWVDGKRTTITGVVLGQLGPDRITAALAAAASMVDHIAGERDVTDLSPHPLKPRPAVPIHRSQMPAPGREPRIGPLGVGLHRP